MRTLVRLIVMTALLSAVLVAAPSTAGADFEAPDGLRAYIKINPTGTEGDENPYKPSGDDEDWPVAKVTFEYDGDAGTEVEEFVLEYWDTTLDPPDWSVAPGVDAVDPDDPEMNEFKFLSNYYTPEIDVVQKIRVVAIDSTSAEEPSAAFEFVASPDGLASDWLPVLPLSNSYEPVNPVTPFRINDHDETPAKECDLFPADSVLHADVRNADVDAEGNALLLANENGLGLNGSTNTSETVDTELLFSAGTWNPGKLWGIPYHEADGSSDEVQKMQSVDVPYSFYADPIEQTWDVPIPPTFTNSYTEDDASIVIDDSGPICELHEMWEIHYLNTSAVAHNDPLESKTIGWGAKHVAQYLDTVGGQSVDDYDYYETYYGSPPTSGLSVSNIPVLPTMLTVNWS